MESGFFVVSDVHENYERAFEVAESAKACGAAVICAGDYVLNPTRTDSELFDATDRQLSFFGGTEYITVHGNRDREHVFRRAAGKHRNVNFIHNGCLPRDDFAFVGFGGVQRDAITSSSLNSSYTYSEIYKGLESNLLVAAADGYAPKDIILVTHHPPKGYLDVTERDGLHSGSSAVLDLVKDYSVGVVVCGHIHEGAGAVAAVRGGGGELLFNSAEVDVTEARNEYILKYDTSRADVTLFLNPGSLGYAGSYAFMKIEERCGVREIAVRFGKAKTGGNTKRRPLLP